MIAGTSSGIATGIVGSAFSIACPPLVIGFIVGGTICAGYAFCKYAKNINEANEEACRIINEAI